MEERLLALLRLALKNNATDIHFSVRYSDVLIEMRVDGRLLKVKSCPKDDKLVRYLQYLSNLDVGKNINKPQTGGFEIFVDDTLLSLRFAIITSVNSSQGVLRILNSKLQIDGMHLSKIEAQNEILKKVIREDNGLVLFSGKTGSGKTTTLYSLLKQVAHKKIYTIEDPIEVIDERFIQLQINNENNLTYEHYIAQVLRHDPDIIMIGEIRDAKAARMAVVAANTGHLVLSTIHASSAAGIISRMSEFGVREDHLYEVLLLLSNQKMVIDERNQKLVLYELMDKAEIEHYRKHKSNSDNFISISKQYQEGVESGIIKNED